MLNEFVEKMIHYDKRLVNITRQTIGPKCGQRVCSKYKMKRCLRLVKNKPVELSMVSAIRCYNYS